jgi:hypothetical protein
MILSKEENRYRQLIIREIEEHFFYNQLKDEFDKILGIKTFQIHSDLGMGSVKYEDFIARSIEQIEEYYRQSKLLEVSKGSGVGRSRSIKYSQGRALGKKHKKKVLDFIDEVARDTFLKYGLIYNQTEISDNKVFMFDGIVPTKNKNFEKFEIEDLKIKHQVKKVQLEKHQLVEYNRYIAIRDYFDKKYDDIYFMFVGWYKKKMIIEQFQLEGQTNKLNEFLFKDFVDHTIRKVKRGENWDEVVSKLWNKEYKIGRFIQTNITWKNYINKGEGDLFRQYYQNLNMEKDLGFLLDRANEYTFRDFNNYIFSFLEHLHRAK